MDQHFLKKTEYPCISFFILQNDNIYETMRPHELPPLVRQDKLIDKKKDDVIEDDSTQPTAYFHFQGKSEKGSVQIISEAKALNYAPIKIKEEISSSSSSSNSIHKPRKLVSNRIVFTGVSGLAS